MIFRSLRTHYFSQFFIQTRRFKYKQNSDSFLSDKDSVKHLISSLSDKQRDLLYQQLCEMNVKTAQQCDASTVSHTQSMTSPTLSQLRHVFFHQSIPFIGFGFLDNFIMIVAGDYIDTTIGVTFGISTMAAAALGNALSDIAGIGSAFYVEKVASKVGVKAPQLSLIQLEMTRTRWSIQLGRAFGVAFGCIIGMFPLLFLPIKDSKAQKANK